MALRPETPRQRRERSVTSAVAVYIIVLIGLQIFLLTVALDGLLGHEPQLAWASAGLSLLLAGGSALFYRYVRR